MRWARPEWRRRNDWFDSRHPGGRWDGEAGDRNTGPQRGGHDRRPRGCARTGAAMLVRASGVNSSSPINPATTTPWPDGRATPSAFQTGCCRVLTAMWAKVATSNGSSATPTITAPTCSCITAISVPTTRRRSARSGASPASPAAGWCCPCGAGPTERATPRTFCACPLVFACFGARIRQPLAGQRLLSMGLLGTVNEDRLPDDYGIDVWHLTVIPGRGSSRSTRCWSVSGP